MAAAPGSVPGDGGEAGRTAILEDACEVMHDAYEAAAVYAGWETQTASRKPWSDVPEVPLRHNGWMFGQDSAALLLARAAWPFDTQVQEWAPKMLADADMFERTYASALERLAAAGECVRAALAGTERTP